MSFKNVAIIDDSKSDQFLMKRMMKTINFSEEVMVFDYADEALAFMKQPQRPLLNLILIDLNMPRMNGFEFADAYETLYPELKTGCQLVMLTGSINPDDEIKANAHPAISAYYKKPTELKEFEHLLNSIQADKKPPNDNAPQIGMDNTSS